MPAGRSGYWAQTFTPDTGLRWEFYDAEPLPTPPPAPRPDLKRSRAFLDWETPDGFSIAARFPVPQIYRTDRRQYGERVDLASLPEDVRKRLQDDIEEAQFLEFGGPDYVVSALCEADPDHQEPFDPERAKLWQAFTNGAPINFATMTPIEPTPDPVVEFLRDCECDTSIEPPPLRTVYSLAGVTVCTPQNLTTITAAIKAGKTAVITAAVSSALPGAAGIDCLGFTSGNPDGRAILWFDSEQSPDDFWHCVHRALRRVGLTRKPNWLHAFCLTGHGYMQAWEAVKKAIDIFGDKHGGIHSLFLDGAADFVSDVNDAAESNGWVSELHGLAIDNEFTALSVIHFNPGTDKSRGHLGSQLERKSESNLALEKDSDGSSVIYSVKNRRAGIPKNTGPRFAYSVEAGMHVSVESRQSAKDAADRDSLSALAGDVFAERPSMRYSDLQVTVKKLLTVSDKTAQRKVDAMIRHAVITKSVAGLYVISETTTT